ncbi:MAG TPA: 4-hydroxy-tetrahydrodipicolinate synthase [Mariprofundaceae bacterium]|nr:4-hydroxy-tetrahydrodipicolinate synthase [Mariprofundaceae bacterium]
MFHGVMTALVTPFRDGHIDEEAFREHLDRQIAAGVDAVVPAGTTGEAATLGFEEHKHLIGITVEHVNGRIPVIAGTGSNNTAESIELTRAAKALGADAALLISPYYTKPSQEGIYQHYRMVAESVHLPQILYNVPGRTNSNITPDTVARLSRIPNIVGIKDATADMAQLSRTMQASNPEMAFYSGDDVTTLPFMAMGGSGVISVIANIAPEAMRNVVEAMQRGDLAEARRQHMAMLKINDAIFLQSNPIPVKAACAMMGWMGWEVRLPLTVLPQPERERLHQVMVDFGLTPEHIHP